MPLRIRCSTLYQTLWFGMRFWGRIIPDYSGMLYSGSYMTSSFDPMDWIIGNYRWCLPCGPISMGRLFGLTDGDIFDVTRSVTSKPIRFQPTYDYDRITYSSMLRNLAVFESTLSGRSLIAPSTAGEHPIRHASYSGELIVQQQEIPTRIDHFNIFGLDVDLTNWFDRYIVSGVTSSTFPLDIAVSTNYASSGYNFIELLEQLADQRLEMNFYPSGITQRGFISNVEFVNSEDELAVSYSIEAYEHNPYYGITRNATWKVGMLFAKRLVASTITPSTNLPVETLNSLYPIRYEIKNYSGDWPVDRLVFHGSEPDSWGIRRLRPQGLCLTIPSSGAYLRDNAVCEHTYYDLSNDRFLSNFQDEVDRSWSDIVPSALFSTVDAFKEAEGSLNTNVLQNLAKLPQAAKMLPQVKEALNVLGKLARRDVSLLTIKQILDLATSTKLQADFEWRPLIDLITNYLPTLVSTLSSIGNIQKNSIGRGSYFAKLSYVLGREEVTLQTRTKLVMDASASALLSAALGLDGLGFLPKPSNLWDLIPFSFIANWLTGVGGAMRRTEYAMLMAFIPAYYVHTYTITSPLSVYELSALKMTNSSTEPARLRLYYRDVSLYTPSPRDSRFGFGIPTSLPPAGLLGSLLYQLFIS